MTEVIDYLEENIHRTEFIAAIRWLESVAPDKPKLGRATRLSDEPVRLSQKPTMAFKDNSLELLESHGGPQPYRLYCNFMGLLGSNGPLPLHLTEYSLKRSQHENDPTFGEFIDLFNHRMLSLFYLAIAEADPVINMDRDGSNRYSEYVSALCGVLSPAASQRDSITDFNRYKYASWLGGRTRSPEGLSNILAESFGLTCDIREFQGDWLPVPLEGQIKLGSKQMNCELGVSTYVGRRVWSIAHKICIDLGPMNWDDYNRFSPGGSWNQTLRDLIKTYLGEEIEWDLKLSLAKGEVRRMKLNGGMKLGFNSWVFSSKDLGEIAVSSEKSRRQVSGGFSQKKATIH